jgi:uncharacterized membrane protein YwzB
MLLSCCIMHVLSYIIILLHYVIVCVGYVWLMDAINVSNFPHNPIKKSGVSLFNELNVLV